MGKGWAFTQPMTQEGVSAVEGNLLKNASTPARSREFAPYWETVMQMYTYVLSLRITHPSIDPEQISRMLGKPADWGWKAGEPRRTPTGTLLQGTRPESYWTCNPFHEGWRESTEAGFEDALEETLGWLEPHAAFLLEIAEQGTIRIWFSSHSNRNFAIELPPRLLGRMAALGISLVHDVYQGA
jgi:hypothetical protein